MGWMQDCSDGDFPLLTQGVRFVSLLGQLLADIFTSLGFNSPAAVQGGVWARRWLSVEGSWHAVLWRPPREPALTLAQVEAGRLLPARPPSVWPESPTLEFKLLFLWWVFSKEEGARQE